MSSSCWPCPRFHETFEPNAQQYLRHTPVREHVRGVCVALKFNMNAILPLTRDDHPQNDSKALLALRVFLQTSECIYHALSVVHVTRDERWALCVSPPRPVAPDQHPVPNYHHNPGASSNRWSKWSTKEEMSPTMATEMKLTNNFSNQDSFINITRVWIQSGVERLVNTRMVFGLRSNIDKKG